MDIRVFLRDPSGRVQHEVSIEAGPSQKVQDLCAAAVDYLGWPLETIEGDPVSYAIRIEREGRFLERSQPLEASGLLEGDTIVVAPVLSPPGVGTDHPVGHLLLPDGRIQPLSPGYLRAGRSPESDLVIAADDTVSRTHALFRVGSSGEVVFEDVGSRNGIRVNGEKVARALLTDGDMAALGDYTVTYASHPDANCATCRALETSPQPSEAPSHASE